MIKIIVPSDPIDERNYDIRFDIDTSPDDRPFYEDFGTYFYLSDRLHSWFLDNNIDYSISDLDYWHIIFRSKKDAILFKLTWGG